MIKVLYNVRLYLGIRNPREQNPDFYDLQGEASSAMQVYVYPQVGLTKGFYMSDHSHDNSHGKDVTELKEKVSNILLSRSTRKKKLKKQ